MDEKGSDMRDILSKANTLLQKHADTKSVTIIPA